MAVTWAGCGPGGDCGASYHWTASSFSPIKDQAIDIHLTHDHGSYANYYDENGWVEGAHEKYPVVATAPAEQMPVIEYNPEVRVLTTFVCFAARSIV